MTVSANAVAAANANVTIVERISKDFDVVEAGQFREMGKHVP